MFVSEETLNLLTLSSSVKCIGKNGLSNTFFPATPFHLPTSRFSVRSSRAGSSLLLRTRPRRQAVGLLVCTVIRREAFRGWEMAITNHMSTSLKLI